MSRFFNMDNSFAVTFDIVLNQKTAFLVFMIAVLFHKTQQEQRRYESIAPLG